MRELPCESVIVRDLAARVCQKIANQTISHLQSIDDVLLSGDDTELKNVWDEICVQVQYSESVYWDAFDEPVRAMVLGFVTELSDFESCAVWLQTDGGNNWLCEEQDERDANPVDPSEIADYVLKEYVYVRAGKWSNPRIRTFIDRSGRSD